MKHTLTVFIACQLLIVAALTSAASLRWETLAASRRLPALRETPLALPPVYDLPVVVSDDQLQRVLSRMAPRNLGDKTRLNHVDHALRCWTARATFDAPNVFSGEAMRAVLTDNRVFAELYGPQQPPLLVDHQGGVRVRVQEGNASSSHYDHTMATLAEVGTPLDFPLVTPAGHRTYRDMVEQSLRDFSLNQVEYEWSALTYALLLPPGQRFVSSEGQEITFDRLARRIMREPLPDGVCFGNHRLYALVALLRIDEQTPILAPEVREDIVEFLRGVTGLLVASQNPDGSWDGNWADPGRNRSAEGSQPGATSGDNRVDRILATGHPLEWWALAPAEVLPPRHVLAAAGQWMVRTFDQLSDEQIEEYYTYLTHAARALSLWRGQEPCDVPHEATAVEPVGAPATELNP